MQKKLSFRKMTQLQLKGHNDTSTVLNIQVAQEIRRIPVKLLHEQL